MEPSRQSKRKATNVGEIEQKLKRVRQALKVAFKENIRPLKDEERALVLEPNLALIVNAAHDGPTGPLSDFHEEEDDEGVVEESAGSVVPRDLDSVLCGVEADVDIFCSFVAAREHLQRNQLQGKPVLEGVDPRFKDLFDRKQLHNVRRRDDPASQRFCAIVQASGRIGTMRERRLALLNLVLWRTVTGTPAFALLLGWLRAWTPVERLLDGIASSAGNTVTGAHSVDP